MPGYSFEIENAHHLYCKLKREYDAFVQNETNSDVAWNCAVTAWHLREWLWKSRLSAGPGEHVKLFGRTFSGEQDYQAELNRQCPKYTVLRDVANGSKHYSLHNPGRVESTTVRPGAMFGEMMLGEMMCGEGPYFEILLDDGSRVRFAEVLKAVVTLWDQVFKTEPCANQRLSDKKG